MREDYIEMFEMLKSELDLKNSFGILKKSKLHVNHE